jgi:FMN phosphatase YigB (HAD superfamily)
METFESASAQRDPQGHICQLSHLDAPYRPSSTPDAGHGEFAAAMTPRALADQYLHDAMPHMELSEALFTDQGAARKGTSTRERLVYHDEKQVMGNATVTYDQTIEGIPVWESGIAVQVELAPMQVIGSQSSVKRDIAIEMPPPDAPYQQSRLNAETLKKLLGIGQRQAIDVSHKELFIYQYRASKRMEVHREGPTGQAGQSMPFALPPVASEIVDGRAYVITAVQFTLGSKETGEAGWLALIEPKTGSVLLLRSLIGCVCCGEMTAGVAEPPAATATSIPAIGATSGRPTVVFFDIGDTLGNGVFSSGNLARIEIFPAAMEVVKELSEKNIRVGIITDPGNTSQDLILSLLQDTGIFAFVDRGLIVQGAKNVTAIFTGAAALAGVTPAKCVFVGENSAERGVAAAAGFNVAAAPDRVIALVDPAAALAWIYLRDPRTKLGSMGPGPNATGQELDRHRDLVSLVGLTTATTGANRTLSGEYVRIQDVEAPSPTLPSSPAPGDFRFSVNTNDFGAANAYHNCDRLFRILEDYGIDVRNYFDGTTFPVRVDPRIRFEDALGVLTANSVNASAPGFRFPPRSDGFRFALAALNTPVGMAADWRVVLHEFGHALLWDHVGSPNFQFAHSAGDALAAILNDVGNRAQRSITFPWVEIGRSHMRPVTQFAWYGTRYNPFGPGDRAGYVAEEMLSSTLFRLYLAAGGESTNRDVQELAASYVAFLIIKSIGLMSLTNNPATPEAYADLLMQADTGVFQFRGAMIPIGILRKAVRWAFEMQGAYRQPPTFGNSPTNQVGNPPEVDVFINDGRDGHYRFVESSNSVDIWNRPQADDGTVHQDPVAGRQSFVYVRISNRGLSAASNVEVRGYQSSLPADQIWPRDWEPLDDAVMGSPNSVLPGQATIVGPFRWIPNSMMPTLLMSVSATGDQSGLGRFTSANPIGNRRLVPLDNNVAQRTMTAVAHPMSVV